MPVWYIWKRSCEYQLADGEQPSSCVCLLCSSVLVTSSRDSCLLTGPFERLVNYILNLCSIIDKWNLICYLIVLPFFSSKLLEHYTARHNFWTKYFFLQRIGWQFWVILTLLIFSSECSFALKDVICMIIKSLNKYLKNKSFNQMSSWQFFSTENATQYCGFETLYELQ